MTSVATVRPPGSSGRAGPALLGAVSHSKGPARPTVRAPPRIPKIVDEV
ncbi:hypothetical protein [Nonomuraea helvata]|uniref:Uncharacterized protein n=1 Tax=Nonomuraea helvata TaxID=37484 RepID=A0ABV5S3D5_9ACTN